jgi:hypothetical protein
MKSEFSQQNFVNIPKYQVIVYERTDIMKLLVFFFFFCNFVNVPKCEKLFNFA